MQRCVEKVICCKNKCDNTCIPEDYQFDRSKRIASLVAEIVRSDCQKQNGADQVAQPVQSYHIDNKGEKEEQPDPTEQLKKYKMRLLLFPKNLEDS